MAITRPNHDAITNYFFYWSQSIIREADHKKFKVLDLRAQKANQKDLESYLRKQNPPLVCFNGHGSSAIIAGQNDEPLIILGENEGLLSKRIVYVRACDAARSLGPNCVKNGTTTFIGYKRKFFLGYSPIKVTRPLTDDVAKLFMDPSNLMPISLIKGNTAEQSYWKSQEAMGRNVRFMLSSKAKQEQRDAVPYLLANKINQVALGDTSAHL